MQRMLGNHPAVRGKTPDEWAKGALNPDWVETLMGYLIGYTLPEGETLTELLGVWPRAYHDGDWRTPNATDGDHGGPNARDSGGRLHLTAQAAWPAGLGAPQYDWEPPRLTTVKENRANRLKALGNSIVPQVARLWFDAIREEIT